MPEEDTLASWIAFQNGFHRFVERLLKFLPYIIGLMMLIYGISRLYHCFDYSIAFSKQWYVYISSSIMILCGLLMIVFRKAPMTTMIGFFTIGISSNRLLMGFNMFFTQTLNESSADDMVSSAAVSLASEMSEISITFTFILSLVYIGIAGNMLISSFSYLRGISRKRRGMLISGLLFLIIEAAQLVIYMRVLGYDFGQVLRNDPALVTRIALYVTYIALLSTEEIREKELLEIQSSTLDGIRVTHMCDPFARIDRDVAVNVAALKDDISLWKDKRGWGPVEYEYRFVIKNRHDHTFITVQKWKDSDRMYFTAAKNHHGSLLDANRFAVDEIILDGTPEECRNIRFYNNEGLYIQIPVRDRTENDLNGRYL